MNKPSARELFDFMIARVKDVANENALPASKAFPRWFAQMYYRQPEELFASDGAGDGKVDLFFRTVSGNDVTRHVVNSKFTATYGQTAPVGFYDEVISFYQLFHDSAGRNTFLQRRVRAELRPFYQQLFKAYDDGRAQLLFLTNCRANTGQLARVEHLPVATFHLDDLVQHILDDLDGAMPRTPDLVLQQIGTTLSPPPEETGVSTTLIFARLIDFIKYMEGDPYDLLFARNVRVSQGNTPVNKAIRDTFVDHPEQFAYSNNGLTVLCEGATHNPASQELLLRNPRVVNGSQTLHSVRAACDGAPSQQSRRARVMVRIITIPPAAGSDVPRRAEETKEIINRICIRSNQQNPIRAWHLRANDEFQMALARRFRQEGMFYERRSKEWSDRASQLRSVGIERGPSIKRLTAIIACFHWKNPHLGPAVAKGNLGDLFEGEAYDELVESTSPELAYQINVVGSTVDWSLKQLRPRRYANARRHIDLMVLALVLGALRERRVPWGKDSFTKSLDREWSATDDKMWIRASEAAADLVLDRYDSTVSKARGREEELTLKNFVRRRDDVDALRTVPLPSALVSAVGALVAADVKA